MKMNIDNPKLTAYALGELDEVERATIARAIADSPEAQRFLRDTQNLGSALRREYALQLNRELMAGKKFATVYEDAFWSKAGPLAIAAVLAVVAVIGAVALSGNKSGLFAPSDSSLSGDLAGARPEQNHFAPIEGEDVGQPSQNQFGEADAGPYAYTGERPFVSAVSRPRSSVPLLVNPVSYVDVRRSINAGVLPARDAVRIEGMINHFHYDYPEPAGSEPFSLNIDVVTCPWQPTHRLARIGLKGHQAITVRAASRIEFEFNPRRVSAYRLIGYDRQKPETQVLNEKTVGLAAGYTLTTFYEIVPLKRVGAVAHAQMPGVAGEASEPLFIARLKLETRADANAPRFIQRAVSDTGFDFAAAAGDLKFAAAVAEFGMILRDSEYKGNGTLQQVLEWAKQGKGADPNGYRAEFIELVRRAQTLKRG